MEFRHVTHRSHQVSRSGAVYKSKRSIDINETALEQIKKKCYDTIVQYTREQKNVESNKYDHCAF